MPISAENPETENPDELVMSDDELAEARRVREQSAAADLERLHLEDLGRVVVINLDPLGR